MLPMELVQTLANFVQRQERDNQEKSFRFTQVEEQLTFLRGRLIDDRGSPEPQLRERKSPPRGRHGRSVSRDREGRRSPRRHSPWESSSPTRDQPRSQISPKHRRRDDSSDSRGNRRSPPRVTTRNPFSRSINMYRVPRWLEKPPELLPIYSGVGDPDRHIDKYEDIMEYRYVPPEMRCRIFPLSLDGVAREWLRSLKPESITSSDQLTQLFCDKFGHARSRPRGKKCLLNIKQGGDESLRDYIERFNSEASTIRDLDDEFRQFFMIQGLREGSDLK